MILDITKIHNEKVRYELFPLSKRSSFRISINMEYAEDGEYEDGSFKDLSAWVFDIKLEPRSMAWLAQHPDKFLRLATALGAKFLEPSDVEFALKEIFAPKEVTEFDLEKQNTIRKELLSDPGRT